MSYRPHWQYYKSSFAFIIATGLVATVFFGFLLGLLLFCGLGPLAGFVGFSTFKEEQYIFYFNLGITKKNLFKATYLINLLIAVPVSVLLYLISLLFADFSIT